MWNLNPYCIIDPLAYFIHDQMNPTRVSIKCAYSLHTPFSELVRMIKYVCVCINYVNNIIIIY